jgi:hypothetical protein
MRARVLLLVAAVLAPAPRTLDGTMGAVWPGTNAWTDDQEAAYGAFVALLGAAVEARRCDRLDACLRDPGANSTYDPGVDAGLQLDVDCADLPYVLRAYFAFKRDLPFGYVAATRGAAGWDARVDIGIVPTAWRSWRSHATPRALLREMTRTVHSGMFRMDGGVESDDFYPVRLDRAAVAPGAIFYDPYGHVSVVARVREDGVVHLLAGSPDGALAWKRFGSGYMLGPPSLGGGFKRFRPIGVVGGVVVRARNEGLADFDARGQYELARGRLPFFRAVRDALTAPGVDFDPIADLEDQVAGLCHDVRDRVTAVELAVTSGMAARPHPGRIPDNIYTAESMWELYATPARDARLKASFRDLADAVLSLDDVRDYAPLLRGAWERAVAAPACRFTYRNSAGADVPFTLDDVLDRVFDLSFDPYHCPEARWGQPEAPTCPDDEVKRTWYRWEQRLRNRIERSYGFPTPLEGGPEERPAIDVRRLFGKRLGPEVQL